MRNWARTLTGRARPTSRAPEIAPEPPAPPGSGPGTPAELSGVAAARELPPEMPAELSGLAAAVPVVRDGRVAPELPAELSGVAAAGVLAGGEVPPATAAAREAVWPAGQPMPPRVAAAGPVGWAASVPVAAVLRERLDGALRVAAVLRADVWQSRYRPRRPPNAWAHRESLAELVALMRRLLAIDGLSLAPLDNLVMFHQRTNEFAGGAVWPAALEDHAKATEVITYCEQCAALLRALLLALAPPRPLLREAEG